MSGDGGTSAARPPLAFVDVTQVHGSGPAAVTALDGVSLSLDAAEIVALVGPSGAGKTTLLQLAGAMARPTSGQVLHDGEDVAGLDSAAMTRLRRRRIGFVFQFFNLVPGLTAIENVALVLRLDGARHKQATERARALLDRVGMDGRRDHLPAELSGGEQQRVAVARALVTQPRVVLADEPTGNLDRASGAAVLDLLSAAAREQSAAVLLVTHDQHVVGHTDRTLSLLDGRLAA